MVITEPFVLPQDIILVPVSALDSQTRAQFEHSADDYALTRPRSRTASRIVNAQVAVLLEQFRSPSRIVEAVIAFSQAQGAQPEQVLSDAYPLLQKLISEDLLLPADSEQAQRISATFADGEQVAELECTILRCVQVLEDTELYQVQYRDQIAALKIVRPGINNPALLERLFERETIILQLLSGTVAPRLLSAGLWRDRRYLLMEWCPGQHAGAAAATLRQQAQSSDQRRLLDLCATILDTYAHLHQRQIIHSDIHPRNIMVDEDGRVKLIDFGLTRVDDPASPIYQSHRGGVAAFFEPEYAQARLLEVPPPLSSMAGEQYGLGALLYFLLTGKDYLDFVLEKQAMQRQIVEEPPVPFARRNLRLDPAVEQVVMRALSKAPEQRFPSVAAMAEALRAALAVPDPASSVDASGCDAELSEMVEQFLQRADPAGSLFTDGLPHPPLCSITYGAAGMAYALYRVACVRQSAALLSQADLWAARATAQIDHPQAFYDPATGSEFTPDMLGLISPYHTASGVHCARALIAHAMGDLVSLPSAVSAFIAAGSLDCENIDLTLGRASLLIGASLLLDAMPANIAIIDRVPLQTFGDTVLQGIWARLDTYAPISECRELPYLGIAHGWAGLLYATLRWCEVSGTPFPAQVESRLDQLAALAEPVGPGARWPRELYFKHRRQVDYMNSWCNGSPGFVFLWTLADALLPSPRYRDLATRAAWNTWESTERGFSLCCGAAGRGYALLNLYNHTGEAVWLQRAKATALLAIQHLPGSLTFEHDSLYKGAVGVACLAADLLQPESGCMPFFERER